MSYYSDPGYLNVLADDLLDTVMKGYEVGIDEVVRSLRECAGVLIQVHNWRRDQHWSDVDFDKLDIILDRREG